MIYFKKTIRSINRAWHGLIKVWQDEQNFRIELFISVIVVALMFYLHITLKEAVILILVIFTVLILEIINTVMERMADILKPKIHHYVAVLKDMMAAAVLLASIAAIIIGVLIFYPYIVGSI
ncbi:MAG: diacylglycerol kinase family protein [Candidatus Komeilibacteria bacterium]